MQKYVVCKRRNVAAAYERFFGPSAGAFPEPWHSRTWNGLRNVFTLGASRLKAAPRPAVEDR